MVVGYSGVLHHPGTGRTTRTISSFWPEPPSASSSVAAVAMPKKSAPNVRVGSAFIVDLPLSANAEGSERPNLHNGTDNRNKGTDNRNKAVDNPELADERGHTNQRRGPPLNRLTFR